MNTIKLYNIEKIAQGRIGAGGYSPNPIQDMRVACKWLVELANEVRRLDAQRRVYRLRVRGIHKLLAKVEAEGENSGPETDWDSGYLDGRHSLAEDIKKILGGDD